MSLVEAAYAVDAEAGLKEVVEGLEGRFQVRRDASPESYRAYYDTFDWRIYQAGGRLTARRAESGVTLRWEDADGTLRHQQLLEEMPGFAWDLPPGALRDDLTPILKMRRLLPLVEVRCRAQALRILDDEEKTVARVRLEHSSAVHPDEGSAGGGPLPAALLRVLPVKGYVAAHRRLLRFVEDELGLAAERRDELALALAAIGRVPNDYSAKLRFPLDPAQRADEAARTIFRSLLQTMEANEEGLRQDLDSEFLHDFRVACRRTRSALSQIKGVLPATVVGRYGAEFKWLGGVTGPTRDLDVYLLKIPGYRAELPPGVRRPADLPQPGTAALAGGRPSPAATRSTGRACGPIPSPSASRCEPHRAGAGLLGAFGRIEPRKVDVASPHSAVSESRSASQSATRKPSAISTASCW